MCSNQGNSATQLSYNLLVDVSDHNGTINNCRIMTSALESMLGYPVSHYQPDNYKYFIENIPSICAVIIIVIDYHLVNIIVINSSVIMKHYCHYSLVIIIIISYCSYLPQYSKFPLLSSSQISLNNCLLLW